MKQELLELINITKCYLQQENLYKTNSGSTEKEVVPTKKITLPKKRHVVAEQVKHVNNLSDDIKNDFSNLFPEYKFVEPPSNTNAQASSKMAPVVLVTFSKNKEDQLFWSKVTKAIKDKIMPAQMLSALHIENLWGWSNFLNTSGLRYIIIQKNQLEKIDLLKKSHNIIVITTEPSKEYINNIALKKELWKELQQKLI